jgi:penicillin amidase
MPASEFVFADADGQIGSQLAALAPVREGWNGALPVPGHRAFEWKGWNVHDERAAPPVSMPTSIVSANGHRARTRRIAEALARERAHTLETFKSLQHDLVAWNAGQLVPLLAAARSDRADLEEARQRLLRWDRRIAGDSEDGRLYVRWQSALLKSLAAARVPELLQSEFIVRAADVLVPALVSPSPAWFDGNLTRARNELLMTALGEALTDTPAPRMTFEHPLAITDAARRRFNVGPFPLRGSPDTVLASTMPPSGRAVGPSLRLIMDLAGWDRSLATSAPGQSGSPRSPHYADLAKLWVEGDYFPLAFSPAAVERATETVLTLTPP